MSSPHLPQPRVFIGPIGCYVQTDIDLWYSWGPEDCAGKYIYIQLLWNNVLLPLFSATSFLQAALLGFALMHLSFVIYSTSLSVQLSMVDV